ncbi:Phosphotyrosyl phosphatase activator [Spinellus fusiger]|nr:Phosphotyrosyl phosphatase activator [Spinellus fusiger]
MSFQPPVKRIITKEHLEDFLVSDAYTLFIDYILRLNESVKGQKIEDMSVSENVSHILILLDTLSQWVTDIPPVENEKSRFGNPSFRVFYDKVQQNIEDLMRPLIKEKEAVEEVGQYLLDSFGNRRRIDYGTGHEANFMVWLLCLEKLNLLNQEDDKAVVLCVFVKYIDLMRKLQFEYWLEPAGSHGVWGLDDYHFLPFLFGSSQLIDHKYIRPKSIHDADIVGEFFPSYMYLSCIHFINTVKTTASLRWHSPMLDDISACKLWSKVNSGMIKMYKAEVLGKLPIMQHFMFGSLIPFDGGVMQTDSLMDDCGHFHAHMQNETSLNSSSSEVYALGQEPPPCCGIPVPSAIAAAALRNKSGTGLRTIPFD